jgi:CheY-like chemotaxis protein
MSAARPLRVLCVDDNQDAADTMAALLELHGYEVRACYDGASALGAVDEFQPDAFLLDLKMPGMDGLELASRLRSLAGPRPLLLVATTAQGTLEDQTRTALGGFHHHFTKPVQTADLLAALGRFAELVHPPGDPPDEPPSRTASLPNSSV